MQIRRFYLVLCGLVPVSLLMFAVGFGRPQGADDLKSVLIDGIPHILQKPDFCGEACAAMYLNKFGVRFDQDYVFDQAGLDPIRGRGCYTRELARALKRIGFQTDRVWYSVPADDSAAGMDEQFRIVHEDLCDGVPSILCMHYDESPQSTEHFRLIVGYDSKTGEVIYHEPAVPDGAYQRMKRSLLIKLWPLKYEDQQWTVIRMPLKRDIRRENLAGLRSTETDLTDADYAQHIMQLRHRLPHRDFHIVIEKPFVVLGDEPAAMVRRRSTETIQWAVNRIRAKYFTKAPDHIVDIWLFKDKDSYNRHTLELFGTRPGTPFGYYSPMHKALVMNISTGGGTLVHELVHPFIEANFPECPPWFNEGLASLYEQCGDRDGHIWGHTNWRLPGLQNAIALGAVPPFELLCGMTAKQFYDQDNGTNYAQARYLCYYMQEQGILADYYHAFCRSVDRDPTGFETLQQVLDESDMIAFQKRWEEFIVNLKL